MTKKPQQSSSVPADAKIAGTGTVTVGGNSTDPTSQSVKITSDKPLADDQEKASGYYTWVVTVDGKQQAPAVRPWLDGGEAYKFVSDFGIADESFASPPKVQTEARTTTGISTEISGTQVPTTGLGLKVKDTITVSGSRTRPPGSTW